MTPPRPPDELWMLWVPAPAPGGGHWLTAWHPIPGLDGPYVVVFGEQEARVLTVSQKQLHGVQTVPVRVK